MEEAKPAELAGEIPRSPKHNGISDSHDLLGGAAEKKLIRKLDLHIIPVVMLLYLLSFLDR